MIEYRILGPLQAVRDGVPLPVGGPRQRAVLARLLIDPGRVVPAAVLADEVWGGAPPASAAKTVQKYVSELRRALGDRALETAGRGYRVPTGVAVDAVRFERLLAAGDPRAALGLWRGEPLDGLPDVPFVAAERSRLSELRLVAEERGAEAALGEGRCREVVPRLGQLAGAHPEREHLAGLLMTALYRSGRQAEALAVFRRHRARLAGELGVEPADELVALERAILRHDVALAGPPAARPAPEPGTPAGPGNVTGPVSSFVGRTDETRRLLDALAEPGPVTLTGPGGVGKTRLAVEVAVLRGGDFPGGTWLIDLSGLGDPRLLVHQVTTVLGVDPAGRDEEASLLAALAHRGRLLLVLDNCEHLVQRCAALVDRIARGCPDVAVLCTSRQPLGVDGERVLVLTPLAEDEACRLFTDRAQAADAGADVAPGWVAEVCRRLDGLPLAVELAVGQLRALGPAELTVRLDERLGFASRRFDAPPRQRTLGDLVAWSHRLLPPGARALFARLGVFASTLTLEAAAAVGGVPDAAGEVATLVDHSLLVREPGTASPARFRLLDTLRLYALAELRQAGEEAAARRAHAQYYLRLLRAAGPRLCGPEEEHWLARLDAERPNLHTALDWAAARDAVLALELGVACRSYWDATWQERFGVAYLAPLLDTADGTVPAPLRAWALTTLSEMAGNPGEARVARPPAEEAVSLFRGQEDPRGLTRALLALALADRDAGEVDRAQRSLTEARELADGLGDAWLDAELAAVAFFIAERRNDPQRAEELGRAEVAHWAGLGSRRHEAIALRHVAVAVQRNGRLDEAAGLCGRALATWEALGDTAAWAHAQATLADITRLRGGHGRAAGMYAAALTRLQAIGDRRCTASTYKNLAVLAAARGEHERCAALYRDAVRLRYELGDLAGLAECFTGLADDLAAQGRRSEVAVLLAAADERRRAGGVAASAEEREIADRLARTAPPDDPAAAGTPGLSAIVGVDLSGLERSPVAG